MKLSIVSIIMVSVATPLVVHSRSIGAQKGANNQHHIGILHDHINDATNAAHIAKSSDRNLQQNPCGYVNIKELEDSFKSKAGVDFTCNCQPFGFGAGNEAQTICTSNEPYCCLSSNNSDGGQTNPDCGNVKDVAAFTVAPFSGYFVPVPTTGEHCLTFTSGPKEGKTVCQTTEFESCDFQSDRSTCSCEATFDGKKCGTCTPCPNHDSGSYDCSGVEGSFNYQISCQDAYDELKRTCYAQSTGKPTLAPKTPMPTEAPFSPVPPPTPRPTAAPVTVPVSPPAQPVSSPVSVPVSPPDSDSVPVSPVSPPDSESVPVSPPDSDTESESSKEPLVTIIGPQSLECTDGQCFMFDEITAKNCNFYALTKYGEIKLSESRSDVVAATVTNLNTFDGPFKIDEGCVMKCTGCTTSSDDTNVIPPPDEEQGEEVPAPTPSSGSIIAIHSMVMISCVVFGALQSFYV